MRVFATLFQVPTHKGQGDAAKVRPATHTGDDYVGLLTHLVQLHEGLFADDRLVA